MTDDGLLSATQAAALAGVSRQTVRAWARSGRLPIARNDYSANPTQPGRLFRRADVLAAMATPPPPPTAEQRQAWGRMGGRPRQK